MITMFLQGGMFMYPLTTCSIIALAIVVDRYLYLRSAAQEADYVFRELEALNETHDVDGIEPFCQRSQGLLTGIFLAGVRKFKQLRDEPNLDFMQGEVNKMMEDASISNTVDLERRLPVLSTVGNVAPLFGFAGTVTGMMSAFEAIAATANPTAQTVAAGIREALITTAAGLIIGIPSVLFYHYFTARIDYITVRTEETANGLVDMLVMTAVHARKRETTGPKQETERSTNRAQGAGDENR